MCDEIYVTNAEMEYSGRTYLETVTITCNVGYTLDDMTTVRTLVCLASGKWNVQVKTCNRELDTVF